MTRIYLIAIMVVSLGICVCIGTDASEIVAHEGIHEIIPARPNSNCDYTFMWWAHGWRGRKVRCLQTSSYGLAMDIKQMRVTHFGRIEKALPYEQAVRQSNAAVMGLPSAAMELSVTVEGTKYICRSGGHPRLIESGRFLQRSDIEGLVFIDKNGIALPADCRLEVIAWPDRLSMILAVNPKKDMEKARASILFNNITASSTADNWKKGNIISTSAILFQRRSGAPREAIALQAATFSDNGPLPVKYDHAIGWHKVELPPVDGFRADAPSLQRIRLRIGNSSSNSRMLRINFTRDGAVRGMTGLVPMLRDSQQNPLPLPVQISKNWHRRDGQTFLYQGGWMHAITMIRIPGEFEGELEFCISRNFWGNLPVASHAQLCLIGWGVDQLWEEAAIGSWGESICYDPDVCLKRSMIDDIRPLMVTKKDTEDGKWGWSNNVGGGDFLVYFNENNQKQYLSRMRTAYLSQGPNLTDVIYSGISADGNISATMRVMTPRCDDINRAYHTFRYDVLEPTKFKRLAFYQVGADNYNNHQFHKLAIGNESGLIKEWDAVQGGLKYHLRDIACPGKTPWISLHESVNRDKQGGAWANRGLVVRAWKARIGGKDCPPRIASFGTENGPSSCNIELAPPDDVDELKRGDFVEATLELLVLPQFAKDYYGPNRKLRQDLEENQNTWRPVLRQAKAGRLDMTVSKGELIQSCPARIELGPSQQAEFTVIGGVGYTPITFTGLHDYFGWELHQRINGKWTKVDQSVFGKDFWQVNSIAADQFSITFNILLADNAALQRFRLTRKTAK